ncbi:MAG: hypothetical protein ABGX43_09440 [Nitrospinaceae bacterium]|jgi:hypothetical protein
MKNLIIIILLVIIGLLLYQEPDNRDLLKENYGTAKERTERMFEALKEKAEDLQN